ncbi:hypothetical protein [Haloarcula marina]|uniref:hypothetical protein n=1 Tax=Haloarcula marina TaxID=2961574 RepID=UPI0020B6BE97|nr:hypothetical protein [Halomicroarcula marina]
MVDVTDPNHRKIFSILSHGKKQRIELVKILEQYEGLSERRVDSLLDQCLRYYEGEIVKKQLGGEVYYERTDNDQLPREVVRPKEYANRRIVNELFQCLEKRLEIDTGTTREGPTEPGDPPLDNLMELLDIAQDCKFGTV